MARNRVIYNSEALIVSEAATSTGKTKHEQLQRVQSANYSFNITRQDVNQFGQLGRLDSLILEAPSVSVDFSYLLGDGFNEQALGFGESNTFAVGFASGHMSQQSGVNLYIVTAADGTDATQAGEAAQSVLGVGNSYVTDYSLDASVGAIPSVSVSMEALNINADSAVSGIMATEISGVSSPAIDQSAGTKLDFADVHLCPTTTGVGDLTALRPGDITLDLGFAASSAGPLVSIASDADGAHVQSASLSFSMSRTPIERIGTKFAYARPVDFPVTASLSVSAIVNELTADNLVDIIANEEGKTIQLTFANPGGTAQSSFKLTNAKLDSESISSSIGSNKTVDLTFSTSIGGPGDSVNNVLFSGVNAVVPFA